MYKNSISYTLPAIFIVCLYIIYMLTLRGGILPALLFSVTPALLIIIPGFFYKQYAFYAFFIVNYLIMGVSRYINMKTGMIMLGLTLGLVILAFIKNIFHPYDWKRSRNFLVVMWLIWFIYCLLEVFNPLSVTEAWWISINGYALFALISAILIPVFFPHYKDFKLLLLLWIGLSLLAAAKGYWQKNHGFDSAELYWLFVEGGARTHIIPSGIRFFSFFSDAANFGTCMGLSMAVFALISFRIHPLWLKITLLCTAFACGYGMIISGTRSAIVVPLTAFMVYLLLCRNFKNILIAGTLLLGAFFFLTQTDIGNGNRYIRRMRTTFDQKDASLRVRHINKEKMIPLLKDKPFGIGLGLSGGRAARFNLNTPLAKLPPDSLHTAYWIETGIVGLILYLSILVIVLLRATYIAVFIVKNKELQNILYAFIAGISGMIVAAYASDVVIYPNGAIISILYAFLFTIPYYEKEMTLHETSL